MPFPHSNVFSFRTQHQWPTAIAVMSVDRLGENRTRVEGMGGGGRSSRTRTRGSGFVRTGLRGVHSLLVPSALLFHVSTRLVSRRRCLPTIVAARSTGFSPQAHGTQPSHPSLISGSPLGCKLLKNQSASRGRLGRRERHLSCPHHHCFREAQPRHDRPPSHQW